MRSALVRRRARLGARPPTRRRRGVATLGLAAAAAVLAGILGGRHGRTDRSPRRRSTASPPRRGRFAPCGSGCPGARASGSTCSIGAARRLRRAPGRRPHASRPRPREHRRRQVRRAHGDRRCRPECPPAFGPPPAHVHARALRGAAAPWRGRAAERAGLAPREVGTATLRSRRLFGDFLAPTDTALADAESRPRLRDASQYHRPPRRRSSSRRASAGVVSSPVLARTYRSYAWVRALGGGTRGSGRSTISSRRGRGAGGARGGVGLLVADRAGAGASRGGARRDRRGHAGSSSSAARPLRCSSPSPSSRRARCGAISRRRAAGSRGTVPAAGSARSSRARVRRRRLRRRARRLGRRRRWRRIAAAASGAPVGDVLAGERRCRLAGSSSASRPPPSRPR